MKSIDGGTGTFVLSIQKVNKYIKGEVIIKNFVIETPRYRKVKNSSFEYFRPKSAIGNGMKYVFSVENITSFVSDSVWYMRKVREFKPDVIVSVDIYCNLIALIAGFLFGLKGKVIVTTHNNLLDTMHLKADVIVEWALSKLIWLFYPRADYLVVVSKGIRHSLKNKFNIGKKVRVIYYGLDNRYFKTDVTVREPLPDNVILSVGRLDAQKDFLTLIKAFYAVSQKLNRAVLWIVGDGPQKDEIKQLISELKLNKKVKFFGWKQDIIPILRKAKIFILSTNREGFGYVIIEAMSQGIPIIASNVPYGPSEILDNGRYGILVEKNNPLALSKSIEKLINDKTYYHLMRRKAKNRSKFFSEEKMLGSYAHLMSKLLPK